MIFISVALLIVACQGDGAGPNESTSETPPHPTTATSIVLTDAEQTWCDLASQPENSEALAEAAISLESPGTQDLEVVLARADELRDSFPENDPAGQEAFDTTLVTALFDWFQTNGESAFKQACAAAYESR